MAIVIGADTVVVKDRLGETRDEEEAFRMLHMLQGKPTMITGLALVNHGQGVQKNYEKTLVEIAP